jgi:hypothetical protein
MQQCWKKGKNQLKPMPIGKIVRQREKLVEIQLKTPNWSFVEASLETTKLVGTRQMTPEISKPTTTNPINNHKAAIQHQLSCCPNKPGSLAATYVTSSSHIHHQTP